MIKKVQLSECREQMKKHLGEHLYIKCNGGRRRTSIHEGCLESCATNVFTIKCRTNDEYSGSLCFSYIDLLTAVVEIAYTEEELAILQQDENLEGKNIKFQ